MKRLLFLAAAWFILGAGRALPAVMLTLDAPVVNAATGTAVTFTGTLTNTDAVEKVFLNDLQFSVPAGLSPQPNTFFANVPGILLPGESYVGPIFSAALDSTAAPGDYHCTLTVKGGADLLAGDSLVPASFTVLSPVVTIAATTPDAGEFGPVAGAFAVTRTGGDGIPLTVNFSIGGTAVNGGAFAAIAPTVTIPSGAASANITVTPVPNNLAEGDRTVVLTLASSSALNIGAAAAATVTVHDKPADAWRLQKFGADANTPAAADDGDWEQDGIRNLAEYGLSLDPKASDVDAVPQATVVDGHLTLSFVPNPGAADILYTVEASTDLTTWSADDVETVVLPNPIPPTRQAFRYRHPVSSAAKVFLRLKLERIP